MSRMLFNKNLIEEFHNKNKLLIRLWWEGVLLFWKIFKMIQILYYYRDLKLNQNWTKIVNNGNRILREILLSLLLKIQLIKIIIKIRKSIIDWVLSKLEILQ